MRHRAITDEDLAVLVRRTAQAASCFIRGDMRTYLTLNEHSEDYTLMTPYGGEPIRGFDGSADSIEGMTRWFQGGEGELEVVQSYVSGDLAVLVAIERQHGRVGGLPDQDRSLRVTLVYRFEDAVWRLVHRHADPLVRRVSHDVAAALARGDAEPA